MSECDEKLRESLRKYHFYHVIELAPGIWTNGIAEFQKIQRPVIEVIEKIPLAGRRVLDVGCRDGLFSFIAEKRGATEIIGIDNDLSRGAVDILIPHFRSKVRMYEMNLLEVRPETFGDFDIVICAGVLYHLRYPFYGLKCIRDLLRRDGFLVLETALVTGYPEFPLLYCPQGDESPYEPTSVTFFNFKGISSVLQSLGLEVVSVTTCESKKPLCRATILCRYGHAASDAEVERYWNGIHQNHSGGQLKHRGSRLSMS